MYSVNSPNSRPSASTATAETSLSGEYEVFLSFCGRDTRYGFTDFLYTDLRSASIRTFRDDNELRVGEEIGPELSKAIENSKISIPIFSKNYASSKWCLLELAHIVKCHAEAQGEKMIFPIFYDVEPYEVRHQSGSYEEAFRQHEKKKRVEVETVQIWREALTKVGELKGLELKKQTGGREGELVKLTVQKCLHFLQKNHQHVPMNMVGMENHIRNLKGLLEVDSNKVRIVGIHGMGGLGKTTMAMIIQNQLCEHFEGHCFLANVRENSKPRDRIVNLQNQLISKIQNREVKKFDDFNEGRSRIKEAVRGRKLLIVLDDVDEKFQVDMLMGNESWFGVRSRIIITTRDKSVLNAIERACQRQDLLYVYASYQPEFMDDFHSLQLFSKYAFKLDSPIEEYRNLSKEVVSIAAGLPLVLVVLGSTFFELEGKDLWEENVRKLREIPNEEVLDKLRFSFEALKYEQKEIFLDIACLFIGSDVKICSYMWDDRKFYPREGINVLINRSLITISDKNEFKMHDQLRDLGRQIVREESLKEPGKRSRLWHEEAMDVLKTSQGTTSINALSLLWQGSESPLSASAFHDVPNLRYLHLGYQDIDGDFTDLLSNLRWLQWRCLGKLTPTNLNMKNLVTLDLTWNSFTEDWEGWNQIKIGKKLKLLNLSNCQWLRAFPHLSMYSSLEILNISHCWSICRLDGLEQLTALKDLDASWCPRLETLPSLSNMKKLVKINLEFCTSLIEIQGLEKLESLQYLNISDCKSLQRLPDFSNLKDLKTFKAKGCVELAEIKGMHKLNSLEHLDLSRCSSLKGVLDMSNLNNIKEFIAPKLEATNFPNSKELKSLAISLSGNLIRFQGLDRLEEFLICGGSMIRLPDLSCLKRLKRLQIRNCDELIEIVLDGLESLERLRICDCSSLVRLPGLQSLKSLSLKILKILEIRKCNELIEIDLGGLESLERLRICVCSSLVRLPGLQSLKSLSLKRLKILEIWECNELIEIDLGGLESLKRLHICDCSSLVRLPGLQSLKSLSLKRLTKLEIWNCDELIEIDLGGLESLKDLRIGGCSSLVRLGELKSLHSLDISECQSIEALPDFSNLEKLQTLRVIDCVSLTKICGLEELKSLCYLSVEGCPGNTSIYADSGRGYDDMMYDTDLSASDVSESDP